MQSRKYVDKLNDDQIKMLALLGLKKYGYRDGYWNQVKLLEDNPNAFYVEINRDAKYKNIMIHLCTKDINYLLLGSSNEKIGEKIASIELDDYKMNFYRENNKVEMNIVISSYLAHQFGDKYIEDYYNNLLELIEKNKDRVLEESICTDNYIRQITENMEKNKELGKVIQS